MGCTVCLSRKYGNNGTQSMIDNKQWSFENNSADSAVFYFSKV